MKGSLSNLERSTIKGTSPVPERRFRTPRTKREMSGCLPIVTSGYMTDNALRTLFICECPMPRSYNEVKKFNTEVTDGVPES